MSKNVYIKCPRCELNFIQKRDKFCPVCKQEMQALSTNFTEDPSGMGMCPICKVNYITDEENVCNTCIGESDLTEEEIDALYGGIVVDKNDGVDDDDMDSDGDDDLDELVALELEGEEEEEEEENEDELGDPLDDFEDLDDVDMDEEDR